MSRPTIPLAHSSVLEASMISFCTAQQDPQSHMSPEFFTQFAPATKQASSGPRDVANMPAPQGQCISATSSGPPKQSVVLPWKISLSILSMFFVAITASSSPGYEIFGIGGIG